MNRPIVTVLMSLLISVAFAGDPATLELEPCINGGVSASGLYSSQEEESNALLALEPCINGAVSATGLYVSQEQENIAKAQSPTTPDDVETSTYSYRTSQ